MIEQPTTQELTGALEAYHELGLSVIPFCIASDGKKKPCIDKWEQWKTQAQTNEEFKTQFSKILETHLFGIVAGTPINIDGETYYYQIIDRDVKDEKLTEEIKAKSKQAIGLMRTTKTVKTRSGGEHLEYYSRTQAKGKKLNDVGMELLALGNLCVMAPSQGYSLVNDNSPVVVDNVEEMFFDSIQRAGLSSRKTINTATLKTLTVSKTYRKKPVRPCFAKLLEREHLEHNEKVALIYELHYCGRNDKEIYDLFHEREAWEPAPEHSYSTTETDKQLEYTLEMAKKGDYRYLKATLAELKICSVDCPFISDADCRKSKLRTNEINPIADVAKPIEQKYKFVSEKLEKGKMLYVYDEKEGIFSSETMDIIKGEICTILDDDTRDKFYKEVENWITYNPKTPKVTMNPDPDLIAVKNGVLKLSIRELKPFSPDYYLTNKIPHNYNPERKNGKIENFLGEIMSEKHRLQHQEFMGQSLYRNLTSDRVAPVLVGEGNNGKSVLIDADTFLLGKDNVSSRTFQDLIYEKFATADLKDKMANLCADMPAQSLKHLGTVKMIITSDAITSQHKHKDAFKWVPILSIMFSCNIAPEIDVTEDNTGTFRRFMMWEFPYVFSPDDLVHKEDKQLRAKLFTEEEAEAYLNYCLDGLDRLRKKDGYTARDSIAETRKAYIKKSNSCQAFVNEAIEITDDPENWFFTDIAYRIYVGYSHREKLPPKPKAVLSKAIGQFCNGAEPFKRRPIGEKTGTPLSAWRYVKLRNLVDIPTEKTSTQKTMEEITKEAEEKAKAEADAKATQASGNVPSVPSVPLVPTSTPKSNIDFEKTELAKSSGTVGTVGTEQLKVVAEVSGLRRIEFNPDVYKNRFCGSDCGHYDTPECPMKVHKIPKDTPMPLKCYGWKAPEPTEEDS